METPVGVALLRPSRPHMQARRLHHKEGEREVMRLGARNPAVLVTRSVSSTVDTPQSASNAI